VVGDLLELIHPGLKLSQVLLLVCLQFIRFVYSVTQIVNLLLKEG
jgi:hypothetical protein